MTTSRRTSAIHIFAALFVVLFVGIMLSRPIRDIDFWYHLATGKFIYETGHLIEEDPFSYTSTASTSSVPSYIDNLKGYWLAQTLMFLSYKAGGFRGVILLRLFLFAAIFLLFYIMSRRQGAGVPATLFLIMLSGMFSVQVATDRPQLFSFLLAPLVVFLVDMANDSLKKDRHRPWLYILLPAVMALWANLHRGFPMGAALLVIYWAAEALGVLLARSGDGKKYLGKLGLLVLASIGATLLNPNTYLTYQTLLYFEGSVLQQKISEYLSPFALQRYGTDLWPYWAFLVITVLALLGTLRTAKPSMAAIIVFLMALSMKVFRYIPFFMYVSGPFVAALITGLVEKRRRLHQQMVKGTLIVLAVAFFAISAGQSSLGRTLRSPVEQHVFPEKAVSFIKEAAPKGRLFNHFNWGGYLIWNLYPDHKVFIDSRTLNLSAMGDYTHMLWNTPRGNALLDSYGISIVLIPGLNPITGELYGLLDGLVEDGRWHLVFMDEASVLFVRGDDNEDIINRFSIPKKKAYDHVVQQANLIPRSATTEGNLRRALEKAHNARLGR